MSFPKSQEIATAYLHEYNKRIKECKDIEEYYALISGILIFVRLVKAQFKELYELDASDYDKVIVEMETFADIISQEVISKFQSRDKELN